jgi:chitinase
VYAAPGYNGTNNPANNHLLSDCPEIAADIPVCQKNYGVKIVMSIGGGSWYGYSLEVVEDGIAFADFLWGAFGPQNATWLANGMPRPFDGPDGTEVTVDGFDFDIELWSDSKLSDSHSVSKLSDL